MASESISPFSTSAPHESGPLWLRLGYRYGFPAAVAAFLLYFVTQVVAADVKATRDETRKAQAALEMHVREMQLEAQAERQYSERISKQLYGLCQVIADGDPISARWCEVQR